MCCSVLQCVAVCYLCVAKCCHCVTLVASSWPDLEVESARDLEVEGARESAKVITHERERETAVTVRGDVNKRGCEREWKRSTEYT